MKWKSKNMRLFILGFLVGLFVLPFFRGYIVSFLEFLFG